MQKRQIGLCLMLLGALLAGGDILFVVLAIDTTPPTIVSSEPHDTSLGTMDPIWVTNREYSCHVIDDGSGVSQVQYSDEQIEQTTAIPLELTMISGTINDGTWATAFPGYISDYTVGVSYAFDFLIIDDQSNAQYVSGTFLVAFSSLLGTWSINGVDITSPTQEIWVNTASITFRFDKTGGAPDSQITCTLSGGVTGTLPNTASSTWELTVSLADGSYDITMNAEDSDGNQVTMSIYQLEIGEAGSSGNGSPNDTTDPNGTDDSPINNSVEDLKQHMSSIGNITYVGAGLMLVGYFMYRQKPESDSA